MNRYISILLLLINGCLCYASKSSGSEDQLLDNLKQHISYLADDKLQGRSTATEGERLAYEYICAEFRKLNLSAFGGQLSFTQAFDFSLGKKRGAHNSLKFDNVSWAIDQHFFPLNISGNGKVKGEVRSLGYGIQAPDFDHDDYANTSDLSSAIVLIDLSIPGGYNPHSDLATFADLRTKVETAQNYGAGAIILYTKDEAADIPEASLRRTISSVDIPVIYVSSPELTEALLAKSASTIVELEVELAIVYKTGHNVLAFLDNNQEKTVVIGAHYDHLGYGQFGSLYTGEPAIHNGADDNASGVAAMIELARILQTSGFRNNNYLFIAFSGEELGLYGSKSFTNSTLFNEVDINYMINLDMVGRLDSADRKLAVNGTGTSPSWDILEKIESGNLSIVSSASGIGPSDHTSFYLKDIPVIHLFTGTHADYHKPSDDEHKINYEGLQSVIRYIITLIETLDDDGHLAFTKTKDETEENVPRFTVGLGVVPDYMFDGKGMRIDGIRDNKPASIAGLKEGDVVIRLGDVEVVDMMSYMKALSAFRKGDTTEVVVKRAKKDLTYEIQF